MEYVFVDDNGMIAEHCCGPVLPEGAVEVPAGFPGCIGMKLDALLPDFSGVKPLSVQVSEGLVQTPEGCRINRSDDAFIRMSQDEIDAVYPAEVWAVPGECAQVMVHKTFDPDGNFGFFPPEGTVKMLSPQPSEDYRAEADGSWTPVVESLRLRRLSEVNAAYDAAVSTLVSTYPATELLTFDKQEAEARAWLVDSSTQTPLVDALAQGRGMDKAELVSRIIKKADAFAVATGYLTGQRQRYEDLLDAATTAEEVDAIVPEYKMPEA